MEISLQQASAAVERAMAEVTARYGRPICVSVCDGTGALVSFARMDGAPLRSIAIAQAKAYTAVRMGVPTTAFGQRLRRDGVPASAFCDAGLTELPGGAPVVREGRIAGAVGVSGLAPEEDQVIADLGAEAAAA